MTHGPIIRFNELFGDKEGTDRVRQQHVPKVGPTLDYLGLSRWIVMSKAAFTEWTVPPRR